MTAVQQLFRNRPELGVIYPRVGLWVDGAHHNLTFNFFGGSARLKWPAPIPGRSWPRWRP